MTPDLSQNLNDRLPDGQPLKRFYALQEFFGSYFHQDWMLNDNSPDAVVRRFRVEASDAVQSVLDELRELLQLDVSDEVLSRHALTRYDLSYDPARDGLTMRQWLVRVQGLLESS